MPLIMRINRYELILQCIIKDHLQKLIPNNQVVSIYTLNRLHIGQKFRMLVGNERTTSAGLVRRILSENKNPKFQYLNSLMLNESREFSKYFRSDKSSNVQESIAKNYLQAACFVKKLKYVKYFKETGGGVIEPEER